jgi:mRNA-degrading endonuclease HigB of HigAB toxin-antitoxin module
MYNNNLNLFLEITENENGGLSADIEKLIKKENSKKTDKQEVIDVKGESGFKPSRIRLKTL